MRSVSRSRVRSRSLESGKKARQVERQKVMLLLLLLRRRRADPAGGKKGGVTVPGREHTHKKHTSGVGSGRSTAAIRADLTTAGSDSFFDTAAAAAVSLTYTVTE
jgi:hypothetical protein